MIAASLLRWANRLLPPCCGICRHRLTLGERTLCAQCLSCLPRTGYHLNAENNSMLHLLMDKVPIERAAAWVYYMPHSEVSQLVYHLKYHHRADYGIALGRMMALEMLPSDFFAGVTMIVPVPVSASRRRQRGYNQSEMLAEGIAQVTQLPVVRDALVRRSFTVSQTRLTHEERRKNVEGAFALSETHRLDGQHVLLVDDICTTGATLRACLSAMASVGGVRFTLLTFGFSHS